ncbi:glycine oxidase ThiO [Bacillus massiliglaciei]|uniref:glycine oxidase ThiO n=1 Tax=Bacillus massiliglaciei TaxID=1816693 RepID=UPI000A610732|nr:glycine oxidase ThiO [Bacillus massiliglaciei]
MKKNCEAVIIGGGIIGCSIAYYLAKEKLDVALFEEGSIGANTTSAAAGMLGSHSECEGDYDVFFPFARSSQAAYATLKDELFELSGIDIGYKTGGILKLAYSELDKAKLQSLLTQPTVQWLEPKSVREMEPAVTPDLTGAAYIKDDVSVLPIGACRAFAESAMKLGASLIEHTAVESVQKRGSRYIVHTNQGSVTADHVVVANGIQSTAFFKELGLPHQLSPVKGECLSVNDEKGSLEHTLFHDFFYIMPRKNGRLVIGATMIENDWDTGVSLNGIETLISKAKRMYPAVEEMKVDSVWAGLRPQTFDQRPFIGRHPEEEGIIFASGHYRNGILLAPATGQMVRDLILNRKIKSEWLEAFKVERPMPMKVGG